MWIQLCNHHPGQEDVKHFQCPGWGVVSLPSTNSPQHTQGNSYSDLYYCSFASRTSYDIESNSMYSFKLALVPQYVGSTVSVLPFGGRGDRTTEVEYTHHIIKFTCFTFAIQNFLVNVPSCANITPVQFGHIFITWKRPVVPRICIRVSSKPWTQAGRSS